MQSAASVRTSARRDNLPVFPKAVGNKGASGSEPRLTLLRQGANVRLEMEQARHDGGFLARGIGRSPEFRSGQFGLGYGVGCTDRAAAQS